MDRITHFQKPTKYPQTLTSFCGRGFYTHITTSDAPSCWQCWSAWERLSYEEREALGFNKHLVYVDDKYHFFKSFIQAIKFAETRNGKLLQPICNP